MSTRDHELRERRLTFYEHDLERLDVCLAEFLQLSGAQCALLVDRDGHMVTYQGNLINTDMDTISALVAGSFAATQLMAQMLGESEFHSLYQQGEHDHILIHLVEQRALLTVLFDQTTTLGMVKLYAGEAVKRLELIFSSLGSQADNNNLTQNQAQSPGQLMDEDFTSSADEKLNELFEE